MRRRLGWTVSILGITLWVGGGVASEAQAANWASSFFQESAHDFGPVPRGAKLRHDFLMTNRLNEPVTILNVRPSCGCTSGKATATVVGPGQSATIEAEMDTRNFVGRKDTVLFVTLFSASGREAEVRLGVGSSILSDVVLNPGTIDFGVVSRGQTPTTVLSVDRIGMPRWRVQRIVSSCRWIDALLQETRREGDAVSYQLSVTLRADAPSGLIRDEIRLQSNDPTSPVIPIQIAAVVRGDLTAAPSLLALGRSSSSEAVSGKILVRASRPFSIRSVEGGGEGFKVEVDQAKTGPVHVLTVSYHPEAGSARGDLRRTFRVHSDLPDEPPVEVTATVRVDP